MTNEKIEKRKLWKEVAREEYILRRNEIDSADNKLLYMILFNFTILTLFVQFINLPNQIYGVLFYFLSLIFYLSSLTILILGISPKEIGSINFEQNNENDLEDELRVLKSQYEKARMKNSKVIQGKLSYLTISMIIFSIAIFFTLIINIIQKGGYV
jgi:hypothetical protein